MVEVEVANLLRQSGEYLVIVLVLLIVWLLAYAVCDGKWRRTIVDRAGAEAQRVIAEQRAVMKMQKREIEKLREREANHLAVIKAAKELSIRCRSVLSADQ